MFYDTKELRSGNQQKRNQTVTFFKNLNGRKLHILFNFMAILVLFITTYATSYTKSYTKTWYKH